MRRGVIEPNTEGITNSDWEIGLLFNGPEDWYKNVESSFHRHGETWLQQTEEIKPEYKELLESLIESKGFFFGFGYVQQPKSKVLWRFKIDKILTSSARISPPDITAPPFSHYDITQGKCRDETDYKYRTWLRVVDCKEIPPIQKEVFINFRTNRPIRQVRGKAHFVVKIPNFLLSEEICKSRALVEVSRAGHHDYVNSSVNNSVKNLSSHICGILGLPEIINAVTDLYLDCTDSPSYYYLAQVEQLTDKLSEASRIMKQVYEDALKLLDILLYLADEEHRLLHVDRNFGDIEILEWGQKCYAFGDLVECCEEPISDFFINALLHRKDCLIFLLEDEKKYDSLKKYLEFCGYSYIKRGRVVLARGKRDLKVLNVEDIEKAHKDWVAEITEFVEKESHGIIILASEDKEIKVKEILERANVNFEAEKFGEWVAFSFFNSEVV